MPAFRRMLVLSVLALALVAAGCSSVTGTGDPDSAATVNDERISVSMVEDQIDLAMGGALDQEPEGEELAGMQAEVLQYLVRMLLLEQGAADLGIEFTDDDLAEAREDLAAQMGGQEALEEQLAMQDMDIEDLDVQLKSQTLETRINAALADDIEVDEEAVREAYDQQFGDRPTVRHILLETEDEAEEVLAELEDGADFNELAAERSTDPSVEDNEGELGELEPGRTVPEFEEAAFAADEGEVVGPVESDFGFHVLEVTAFEAPEGQPDFEEVEDDLRAQLTAQQGGQEAFLDWINSVATEADVDVNPRFGEWDAENIAVVPSSALDNDS